MKNFQTYSFRRSKLLIALLSILLLACKKSSFLDENPNKKNIVPDKISDFQAMLDYHPLTNLVYIDLLEFGADNYSISTENFNSWPVFIRNNFLWNDDIETLVGSEWKKSYAGILDANLVSDGLSKIGFNISNKSEWENAKGTALFLRASHLFNLSQIFCPTYDSQSAEQQLGLPLRLTSEVDEKISRSSNKATYERVISDLISALDLLPVTPKIKTRPSKNACYALLARVYLVMHNYQEALKYANLSLAINSTLLDYNSVTTFDFFNAEVIWHATNDFENLFYLPVQYSSTEINPNLVAQYAVFDRRTSLFFTDSGFGGKSFIGTYAGFYGNFAGLATDEIYLIKAECEARLGNKDNALTVLNILISNRFDHSGSWSPYTANTTAQALQIILTERRKELVMRGLRLSDIKRLNKEGANIIQNRVVNGVDYVLPPNDKRYTYLIPAAVIGFNPGMLQNER